MGRQDFDNLLKLLTGINTVNTGTIVSLEMDFELPRGFIAKIWQIDFSWIEFYEDAEGLGATEQDVGLTMVLIRDPDDITTQAIPLNSVQHDVVAGFSPGLVQNPTGPMVFFTEMNKSIRIPEHIDLITARNMRFNSNGLGPDVAILTESKSQCDVYYTLEKVTDADILELLDIL